MTSSPLVHRTAVTGRPGVLLDVDGTLIDSNYLHTLAWSRALSDAGEWAPMIAIHRLVGMGGDQLVPHLLGHDSEIASQARPRRYRELMDEVRAFPGAADLVRYLHDRGLVVVLATSSPQDELDAALQVLGAGTAIDAHTTKDDVKESKPAPDLFQVALHMGGVDPHLALVIGDSVWDIDAARAADLPCVGVETGGFSSHELSAAGAVHVYQDVHQMLDQIHAGPLGQLLDHAIQLDRRSDLGLPTGEEKARTNRALDPPT